MVEKQTKLQKYNQRIIAIVGTLFLVILLIALIAILKELVDELFPDETQPYASVFSEEKQDASSSENLVTQQISYGKPILVDTTAMVFVIPVHNEIVNKTKNKSLFARFTFYETVVEEVIFEYSKIYSRDFNNLILWDYNSNSKQVLLKDRIAAGGLTRVKVNGKRYLVFVIADTDSNKDGLINNLDNISLLIYSLDTQEKRKIAYDNATLISYHYLKGRNEIFMEFKKNQQKSEEKVIQVEPSFFMLYDYEKETMTPVVDPETDQSLKKMYE